MEESFEGAINQVFRDANFGSGGTFKFKLCTRTVGAVQIAQCIVSFEGGNEFLRLDILIKKLEAYGGIDLIEYRGANAQEKPQILFQFKFDGLIHQLIYVFPDQSADSE